MRGHYTETDIVNALQQAGVQAGDTVFSHVSLLNLGFLKGANSADDIVHTFYRAIQTVIGPTGCFMTPAYSYSFCKNEAFDPKATPSDCGPFSNHLIGKEDVERSHDPLFSVLGFGALNNVFKQLPQNSFGPDCLYDRLLKRHVKIVNIGLSLFYLTAIHHLEYTLDVPYRYDKKFSGMMCSADQNTFVDWTYYVRYLDMPSEPDCSHLQTQGLAEGLVKQVPLGLGQVVCVPLRPYFELAKKMYANDPWYLTVNARWQKDATMPTELSQS